MATNQRSVHHGTVIPPLLDVEPLFLTRRDASDPQESAKPFDRDSEPRTKIPEVTVSPVEFVLLAKVDQKERISRFNYYHQLHLAAFTGDWEAAKGYLEYNVSAITKEISITCMNALHVAACNGHTEFVKELVERMPKDALSRRGRRGYTALHLAAIGGDLKMAKALIERNPQLAQIPDKSGDTPLLSAVKLYSKLPLVRYLASVTKIEEPPEEHPFRTSKAGELMINLTHMGFHDISLYLIQRQPGLALAVGHQNESILKVLAYEPENFHSGAKLKYWQRWIYKFLPHGEDEPLETSDQYKVSEKKSQTKEARPQVYQGIKGVLRRTMEKLDCIDRVRDLKLSHERASQLVDHCLKALVKYDAEQQKKYFDDHKILKAAAKNGSVEIVTKSLHYYPHLIFSKYGGKLLKNAIKWRQKNIFNLALNGTALEKMLVAKCYSEGNILFLAAKLPKNQLVDSSISGAALQMQREMQWYKAVEDIAHPRTKKMAFNIFSVEHKQMRENAEKWMKDTSDSSMLVSTLIATVVFAAAFTVPGGNNEKGTPNFLNETSFMVFVFSDAVGLFSSITSILMFFSILTSGYKEEDFLRALPKRMIIGLASLFFAIATMMVAFGAGLAIVLSEKFKWVWCPIIFMALLPAILFIMPRLPLIIEMAQSTYGRSIFQPDQIWKQTRHRDAGPLS